MITIKLPLFLSRLFKNFTLTDTDRWVTDGTGGGSTYAGPQVNQLTAMQTSAVYACVRILSETVASLPLPVYRRISGGGKERVPTHPLYTVLHDMANSEMTAFTFRETMQAHLCLWGNAYAEIEYDAAGRVRGLWPIRPDKVKVERDEATLELRYKLLTPNEKGLMRTLEPWQVLHIPGLGFDGLIGYSPIAMAKQSIGLALATEEYGARFFGDGTNIGGIAKHPGKLTKEGADNLRASINEKYAGLGRSHRIMLLEEGMDFEKVGVPPNEAQFLETRKFQLAEIARIFRVPLHMIGELDRSTNNNIEHQSIEFVVHTIRPWLVRWEQAINAKLFSASARRSFYAEHLVDGLLRGDIKSRYEAYQIAVQNGWFNRDEIREMENSNPIPDGLGKIYTVNAATIPLEQARQPAEEGGGNGEKVLESNQDPE